MRRLPSDLRRFVAAKTEKKSVAHATSSVLGLDGGLGKCLVLIPTFAPSVLDFEHSTENDRSRGDTSKAADRAREGSSVQLREVDRYIVCPGCVA